MLVRLLLAKHQPGAASSGYADHQSYQHRLSFTSLLRPPALHWHDQVLLVPPTEPAIERPAGQKLWTLTRVRVRGQEAKQFSRAGLRPTMLPPRRDIGAAGSSAALDRKSTRLNSSHRCI